MPNKMSGFTLIEVMVVVVLVAAIQPLTLPEGLQVVELVPEDIMHLLSVQVIVLLEFNPEEMIGLLGLLH